MFEKYKFKGSAGGENKREVRTNCRGRSGDFHCNFR
uniref:Uncharacterized protein n=1 Tax=Strongyloides stercoralis TaxID=6248 RepID=A0A0K0DYP1_STRER